MSFRETATVSEPEHHGTIESAVPDPAHLNDRLSRVRGSVLELLQLAREFSRSDEAACATVLADLLEIAQCWQTDADDHRISQAAAMVDFSDSALPVLLDALANESADPALLARIRSDAHHRWGEYLDLLESSALQSTVPARTADPWDELMLTVDTSQQSATESRDRRGEPSAEDVNLILSALGDPSTSDASDSKPRPTPTKLAAANRTATSHESARAERSLRTQVLPPEPPPETSVEIEHELLMAYSDDANHCLAIIEQALLGFEADPSNSATSQQICRALHTLKGASASVGLSELARYLHDLEDFVQTTSTNGCDLSDIQPMLRGVDAVRAQLQSLVSRHQCPPAADSPHSVPVMDSKPQLCDREPSALPLSLVSPAVAARPSSESIRVEASRIDRLMDLLGELVISRNRRDTQVSRLKQLHTELTRTASRLRTLGDSLGAGTPESVAASHRPRSDLGSELVNDVNEIARSLRELYEPVVDENLAASRLMGQFRHELMELRRLPVSGLYLRLQRAARDAAHAEGKQIRFELRGEHTGLEPALQERLYEPLLHLVRNAVSHGIESEAERVAAGKQPIGIVTIDTRGDPTSLLIEVRDDGKGLDYDAIQRRGLELGLLTHDRPAGHRQLAQLIFHPGFSTRRTVTEVSGRGVGLDVVATVLDRLRGKIEVESSPKCGTTVRLRIPLRSAIEHTMVFRVGGHLFALPMQYVQAARPTSREVCRTGPAGASAAAGTPSGVASPDAELPFFRVRDLLSLNGTPRPAEEQSLIVGHGTYSLAGRPAPSRPGSSPADSPSGGQIELLVDAVIGPEEVVVRSLPLLFKRHRLLAGVTLSGAGEIVLLLEGRELLDKALRCPAATRHGSAAESSPPNGRRGSVPPKVLVVDDSVSARRTLSRMLQRRGFSVTEAADGLEALDLLRTSTFSLVLTDLEMPRLEGMELLAEIRRMRRACVTAVAVVSSIGNREVQDRARELGANGYVAKPVTDASLTELLSQLRLDGRN